MTIQTSLPDSSKPVTYTIPSEFLNYQEDEVDLLQYLILVKNAWKTIIAISFVAALTSVVIALSIPKVYRSSVEVALPTSDAIAAFNETGLGTFTKKELLKHYYDLVRSQSFFREFLLTKGYLQQLFPQDYNVDKEQRLFAAFAGDFTIEIIEPIVEGNEFVENPTMFSFSAMHIDEELLVKILNEYADYTNYTLTSEIKREQTSERSFKLAKLNRDIEILRADALNRRNLDIEKIQTDNLEKIAQLEQSRALLLVKAKADRQTQIALAEENNLKQVRKLEQQKQLLVSKAAEDRAVRIANAKEARTFAVSLNITYPTKLENLTASQQAATSTSGKTEISLSESQTLPLYLMGTKYLDTLIKSLEGRDNDAQFISEIAQINSEIEKAKNDPALFILKNRQSDLPYLTQINKIEEQIAQIKDDQRLKALISRKSDDPFIEKLPDLQSEMERLKSLPMSFDGVKTYSSAKPALVTKKAVKPNRKMIAIVGTILGGMFAVLYVLVSAALKSRKNNKRLEDNS